MKMWRCESLEVAIVEVCTALICRFTQQKICVRRKKSMRPVLSLQVRAKSPRSGVNLDSLSVSASRSAVQVVEHGMDQGNRENKAIFRADNRK